MLVRGVFAWEGLSSEEREEVDQLSDMVGEGGRTMGVCAGGRMVMPVEDA